MNDNGLSESEALERLKKYGLNQLPETPPPTDLQILLKQFKEPLVYILFVSGIVTFFLNEIPDTLIIIFSIFLNAILGFIQERKASKALSALKKLIHPTTKVIRSGKEIEIDSKLVVPGDLLILESGVKIAADGELVESNRFFVDEAILTGESTPVVKTVGRAVFMGTIVTSGRALMVVAKTGQATEMGKIAASVQTPYEDTPLERELTKFSKQLTVMVVILTALVFSIGFLRGLELKELLKTSVALAVSSIPEGILIGLTIVLAIGMQRILKRKGLVRHLISAETLGGVTTICIDKTGTLTEGKMQVVDHTGEEKDLAYQMILANDKDDPLVLAGYEWAKKLTINNWQLTIDEKKQRSKDLKLNTQDLIKKHTRLDSIPFSSENKYFACLNEWNPKENMLFVNGAPEMLIQLTGVDAETKKEIIKKFDNYTNEGKRVIALIRKKIKSSIKEINESDINDGFEWVGLIAFSDPVRHGVKEALQNTIKAGIKLMVITGDYPSTAISVINQLGLKLKKDSVLTGEDLNKMTHRQLVDCLKGNDIIRLFARVTPGNKLKIVEALKENEEVVAMMGDGVNDAPALNKADIGVVVESASDVAKESSDLVLMDSSFSTIVSAVEEGRVIFDNVRKIILYLMSDSFEEIIAVVGTIILGLPIPVTAAQILWINLVSDGFPDMALTVDPKRAGIMDSPPRSPREHLISGWMKGLIFNVSLVGGIIALAVFIFYYKSTSDLTFARSITFAVLGVNSLVYVFSIKTLKKPFWVENPFDNMWLNLSVVAGLLFQYIPFSTPTMRSFFGVSFLGLSEWGVVFALSALMFVVIEVSKVLFHNK